MEGIGPCTALQASGCAVGLCPKDATVSLLTREQICTVIFHMGSPSYPPAMASRKGVWAAWSGVHPPSPASLTSPRPSMSTKAMRSEAMLHDRRLSKFWAGPCCIHCTIQQGVPSSSRARARARARTLRPRNSARAAADYLPPSSSYLPYSRCTCTSLRGRSCENLIASPFGGGLPQLKTRPYDHMIGSHINGMGCLPGSHASNYLCKGLLVYWDRPRLPSCPVGYHCSLRFY